MFKKTQNATKNYFIFLSNKIKKKKKPQKKNKSRPRLLVFVKNN